MLRWGICGSGKVAFDFANALAIAPERHQLVSVAGRDLMRAQQLAEKFKAPKAYGNYAELADDPDVDAVYIATVNNTHFEVCKLFLEAGKAVLCEKALCCGVPQAKALIEIARKRGVFLMEGLWNRTLPAYAKLRELIAENIIGTVRTVETRLLVDRTREERIMNAEIGGGVSWFTGVYGLGLIDYVFHDASLLHVRAAGTVQNGVDSNICATLQFSDGRFASMFHSATFVGDRNFGHAAATIFGDAGHIRLRSAFVAPFQIEVFRQSDDSIQQYNFEYPKGPFSPNYFETGGLLYEADHVLECLSKNLLESPLVPLASSLRIQQAIDGIRSELGLQPLEALPIVA